MQILLRCLKWLPLRYDRFIILTGGMYLSSFTIHVFAETLCPVFTEEKLRRYFNLCDILSAICYTLMSVCKITLRYRSVKRSTVGSRTFPVAGPKNLERLLLKFPVWIHLSPPAQNVAFKKSFPDIIIWYNASWLMACLIQRRFYRLRPTIWYDIWHMIPY